MGPFSHPLVREIAVVLLLKLAVIYALWFAFFRLPEPRVTGAGDVGRFLVGEPTHRVPQEREVTP